jgi:translation initiation factor 3 subunit E
MDKSSIMTTTADMTDLRRYDLTRLMAPYLDVHMVGPLLDNLRETGLYEPRQLTREKIRAMDRTNMVELVEDEYQRLPEDIELAQEFSSRRPALEQRKEALFAQIDNESATVQRVTAFFSNEELISTLRTSGDLNTETLAAQFSIGGSDLEEYLKFSKFKYECGMYGDAEVMLSNFLSVAQAGGTKSLLSALWGRLACRIVQANWDSSREDLKAVKLALEGKSASSADQLKQRAWLLHWALFVHLNQRDGMDALVDLLTDKAYLSTVENLCPWMLRYFVVAAVLSPRRRSLLRELLAEIMLESYQYSDPLTQFVESLFDQFDFNLAQQKLKECRAVMKNDFFLCIFADKFVDEARALICELYCTINKRVDLALLATKLELSEDEAERWMVSMVRTATGGAALDARIDSAGKQVVMSSPGRSAHQQVIDKARDLTVRCAMLGSNMEAILQEQHAYLVHR